MYSVRFYTTARGECPFEAFLDGAQPKVKAKFINLLRDGIRELRVRSGHNRFRALYFFIMGRHIIITHGILKNMERVPWVEIERAISCRRDLEERLGRGEASL